MRCAEEKKARRRNAYKVLFGDEVVAHFMSFLLSRNTHICPILTLESQLRIVFMQLECEDLIF